MRLPIAFTDARDCFVALPLKLAQQLHQNPHLQLPLPLQLKWKDRSTGKSVNAFVAWAGAGSDRCVEIGRSYAECLGMAEDARRTEEWIVDVQKSTATYAEMVTVDPLTPDDWEIIEANIELLELQILNQLNVVFMDQVFPLFINEGLLVRLKVTAILPTVGSSSCSQLQRDSEIAVAPKPKPAMSDNSDRPPPHVTSSLLRVQAAAVVTPGVVLMNPATLSKLSWPAEDQAICIRAMMKPAPLVGSALGEDSSKQGQGQRGSNIGKPNTRGAGGGGGGGGSGYLVALIRSDPTVREGHIGMNELARQQCGALLHSRVLGTLVSLSPKPFPKKVTIRAVRWVSSEGGAKRSWPPTVTEEAMKEWMSRHPHAILHQGSLVSISSSSHGFQIYQLEFDSSESPSAQPTCLYRLSAIDSPQISIGTNVSLSNPAELELKVRLQGLGGVTTDVQRLLSYASTILEDSRLKQETIGVLPLPSLVGISGKHGSGKTTIAEAIMAELKERDSLLAFTSVLDMKALVNLPLGEQLGHVRHTIDLAVSSQPSIVLLEDIDALMVTDQQGEYPFGTEQFAAGIAELAKSLSKTRARVALLATTKPDKLHKLLKLPSVLAMQMELHAPDKKQRQQILACLLGSRNCSANDNIVARVAKEAEGFMPADLCQIVERASLAASKRSMSRGEESVEADFVEMDNSDFEAAMKDFTPLGLKGINLHKSDVEWEDVGGMSTVKGLLKETFEWPTKYGKLFAKCPLKLRKGILLYGPPGCGKTLIASAVAKECGLNFISVKGPELLNKYIGASEAAVRDLFDRAAAASPCILFFDEFDSIAPRRGHDNTGVTDRVVNQFLTQLDGVESYSSVYVLAATSRPDLIDPALLRPGRLDKCVFCGMPDEDERERILAAVSRKLTLTNVSLRHVAEATEGLTGADLQALLYNAQLEVIHDMIDATEECRSGMNEQSDGIGAHIVDFSPVPMTTAERVNLTQRFTELRLSKQPGNGESASTDASNPQAGIQFHHIETALRQLRPSVSATERKRFDEIYANFLDMRGVGGDQPSGGKKATLA